MGRRLLSQMLRPVVRLACLLALSGCGLWRPTTVPLRTIDRAAACPAPRDTLLVLLPGSYSLPEDFDREGFVAAVRARRLAVDLRLVDAHVGYYRERSIVDRLHDDVIGPARSQGYRKVWLAGISIGGLGAMLYADAHPEDIDGVVAIAPYLGTPQIARAVKASGGLRVWTPASTPPDADELDVTLWRWLKESTADRSGRQPLYLGYGLTDRFVANDDVLAAALPPARVFTAEGGHDWPAWKAVWARLLDTLPLPADPTCADR